MKEKLTRVTRVPRADGHVKILYPPPQGSEEWVAVADGVDVPGGGGRSTKRGGKGSKGSSRSNPKRKRGERGGTQQEGKEEEKEEEEEERKRMGKEEGEGTYID